METLKQEIVDVCQNLIRLLVNERSVEDRIYLVECSNISIIELFFNENEQNNNNLLFILNESELNEFESKETLFNYILSVECCLKAAFEEKDYYSDEIFKEISSLLEKLKQKISEYFEEREKY